MQRWGEGIWSNIQFVLCICPSLCSLQSLIRTRSTFMMTTAAFVEERQLHWWCTIWEISGGCIFGNLWYTVSLGVSYILGCKIWPVWHSYCSRELVPFTTHIAVWEQEVLQCDWCLHNSNDVIPLFPDLPTVWILITYSIQQCITVYN